MAIGESRAGIHRPRALFRWRRNRRIVSPLLLIILSVPASGQQLPSFNNFGSTGLLDLPSAHMAPDGRLAISASYFENNQHYNLTFQALPWLETGFRYSGIQHFNPQFPVYWDRAFSLKARLIEESDLLPALAVGINDLVGTGVYSGEYVVATKNLGPIEATLGVGWGRLGSINGFRNPLSLLSRSFDTRSKHTTGLGGDFSFGSYFHGSAALFGGIAWHTPIENLILKAEYSSDRYDAESLSGSFKPRNQINFGAAYTVFDNVILTVDWMYGKSLGGSLTLDLDPTSNPFPQRIEPPPPPLTIRTSGETEGALRTLRERGERPLSEVALTSDALWQIPGVQNVGFSGRTLVLTLGNVLPERCAQIAPQINAGQLQINTLMLQDADGHSTFRCSIDLWGPQFAAAVSASETRKPAGSQQVAAAPMLINATGLTREIEAKASAKLRKEAAAQNLQIETISLQNGTATIYYTNLRYLAEAEAIDKLLRLALADLPPEIEQLRFIAIRNGLTLAQYTFSRSIVERNFEQEGNYDLLANGSGPVPGPASGLASLASERATYPHFNWAIMPQLRQEFFDPSNPLGFQLLGLAYASLELLPGLSLDGEVEASIADNFNTARPSDSVIPHVRTDFLQYFLRGKNGIGQLRAQYQFRLSPTVFAAVRAGYLESMFAGVGGEILWRPEGQRWALGADFYEVKQRGYERLFTFLPYTQATGHVTLYYASPWYDLNFMLRAGQYLAGDRGLTLQISRRFSTGVEAGVFVTRTNLSSTQFGEGSFDKGIFLRIPIDWIIPTHTQLTLDQMIRPVQRDGGQVLVGDATLFDFTSRTSEVDAHLMKWN